MSQTTELSPLIRTKLLCPRVAGDLIERTRLLEHLNARRDRPFTLVSASAGFGKTTLVYQWLDQAPYQTAWLSLDENDNDPVGFLSCFVAAIQSLFPEACSTTHSLLTAPQTPPLGYLTATFINEITDLPEEILLVLDDYHLINHQDIHRFVSMLTRHSPPPVHLVIVTRQDVPFSITRLRASQTIIEIRAADLRFTPAEVQSYLKLCLGTDIPPEIVTVLAERTEGWAVGLRLACLSLRDQDDYAGFLETFQGTHQYIMEYLVDEVLSRQPQLIQVFLLGTSILDRFCAPLGDALLEAMAAFEGTNAEFSGEQQQPSGREILAQLGKANLFIVSLDQQGEWFRYHHLFKDLLWHKLKTETTPVQRAALHTAAGTWLDQNGFAEEALRHYFAANDTPAAAHLVARQRYDLMNRAQWQRLTQWLRQFSPDTLDQYPDLLMLKAWLVFHKAKWLELPAALQRVEAALAQASLTPEAAGHLQGEISAVRSFLAYIAGDAKNAIAYAQQSIQDGPPELWIVRIQARQCLGAAYQMEGDLDEAYAAIYRGFEEETEEAVESKRFKATLLVVACDIHWMAADLHGMAQAADQCIMLSQHADSSDILNLGHYGRGRVYYHQNDLTASEQHFAIVVQQPYLNHGECFAFSSFGLALTYQAQGQAVKAREVAESATKFFLETGNTYLLPIAEAFEAELALMQGQLVTANQWAARLDSLPPLTPIFEIFSPHLTLVKVWLAQDTPASRQQAAGLLEKVKAFVETTHNTRFLIETLALQALLNAAQDEQQAALELLAQAIALAQPGGFIRLFVDLGQPMADLLIELKSDDPGRQQYVSQIQDAIQKDDSGRRKDIPQPLIEPLTRREQDVLNLLDQRLTDKEIAQRLVISRNTVKTHIKGIFAKLNVKNRYQAAARARELGLLPPK